MVRVREALLSDAGLLLAIYDYYVRETAVSFEYTTPSLDEFRKRMRASMARYPYLVAEEDGVAVGYAYAGALNERAAYSHSAETTIYIDRFRRRQGLGRLLYEALEERLAAGGIRRMYACIGYPAALPDEYLTTDSPEFHARMGFHEVGHFHGCGCKFGRPYDMIWMEKIIG